jgi:hypothetical protein
MNTAGFAYHSVSDVNVVADLQRAGINWTAQFVEFDVTRDHPMFTVFPRNMGYRLEFFPNVPNNGFVRCNLSACELVVTYETFEPRIPDMLNPNGVKRHPNSEIAASWRFNRNNAAPVDTQTHSILRYKVNNGNWVIVSCNNTANSHTFSPGTFIDGDNITWAVRTGSNLGLSEFSEEAVFDLASTPPLAPLLVYPLNVAVDSSNGAMLEWRYNSQYELQASKYEIMYRFNEGEWKNIETDGATSVYTEPITAQGTVEWRVRATGLLGDLGPWSGIGVFWTIGIPDTPVIVHVLTINRPVVTFSALGAMSWEMVFHDSSGGVWYKTGDVAFDGDFNYNPKKLFVNGGYSVMMRVRNEYGLYSEWASMAFTVDCDPAPGVCLTVVDNYTEGIKLNVRIDTDVLSGLYDIYVYREDAGGSSFTRIASYAAAGLESVYVDYAVDSGAVYRYFVRIAERSGNGYSDSNKVRGTASYSGTAVMSMENPGCQVKLRFIGGKAGDKAIETVSDKYLIHTVGKKIPAVEYGGGSSKKIALAFLCETAVHGELVKLSAEEGLLILRDTRFGAVIGVIPGPVKAEACEPGYVSVSFEFVEAGTGGGDKYY